MARLGQSLEMSSFPISKCISNVTRNTKTMILGSFWIENCIFKHKFQIWYISNKEPWVYGFSAWLVAHNDQKAQFKNRHMHTATIKVPLLMKSKSVVIVLGAQNSFPELKIKEKSE